MWHVKKKLTRNKDGAQSKEDGGHVGDSSLDTLSPPNTTDSERSTSRDRTASASSSVSFPLSLKLERLTSSSTTAEPSTIPSHSRQNTLDTEEKSEKFRQNTLEPATPGPNPSQSRSFSRSTDPLGLTVLYEPQTSPSSDIIFIHGLGGTSRGTWAKEHKSEHFWPEKWLPHEPDIHSARILTFGYNANFATVGAAPITGIGDFAKDLLYAMKFGMNGQVEELEIGQRPTIFVAHSMGGLVVKQAYMLGLHDEKFTNIISSVRAILFLATPHRGSDLAGMLNRILAACVLTHNPKTYVSELKHGSQTIATLNDQFRHVASDLDIISFYETAPTGWGPKKVIVIDKDSATLGYADEISTSLNADHHGVCKFDHIHDSNYITVRNALKTLITSIRSTGRNLLSTHDQSNIEGLKIQLAPSESQEEDLEFFRKRWTPGTCEWILRTSTFQNWEKQIDEAPTILWLYALPGSGKSILSSFIVDNLLRNSLCVYYFFRFGDQAKRSLSICLRTVAFQLAEKLPQFCRALKNVRFTAKTVEKMDAKIIWEKIFIGILFKLKISITIYCVIDALDESDHPMLLVDLMRNLPNSSAPLKVLLVSRQTPELISTFDRVSIAVPSEYLPVENTKKDIRIYVENEVRYMHAPQDFKDQIVERLVAGANGNFLWASLALVEVMECNTEEDIDATLKGIPSGMEDFYHRMEQKIIENTKPRDQRLGQMILTWVICSQRALVVEELQQALTPEYSVMLDISFTITRVCGQFVVVDSANHLAMVHQTARDHILTTETALGVTIAEGHEKILVKCLSVLLEKFQRRDSHRRSDDKGFQRYAMTSWAYHLNRVSPEGDQPLLLLAKFLRTTTVLAWIVSLSRQNQLKVLVSSSKSMMVYVRRKQAMYETSNPLSHRLQELDLLEAWATDFLKILGKFGQNLKASPNSIYEHVPPFCPKRSMIYRHLEQRGSLPQSLSVEGISKTIWDDSLAKISVGPEAQALTIICSGDHFAVLTSANLIVLYDSTTFDVEQMIEPMERICAISFSSSSNLLATYGFRATKVWSMSTGQAIYEIQNPRGSRALTITFSADDTKLVVGSNDGLISIASMKVPKPEWSLMHPALLKTDSTMDGHVQEVPWCISFNSDIDCVAVAYRGSPLCVWSMDPPELIGRFMRIQDPTGSSWAKVDQVIWHPRSDEVLGLFLGGHLFRWNPYENTQQQITAKASMIASSPEGKFFVTADSNGTIRLYNFNHFSLVYQLSCENMVNDICFSPDGRRLYDLRGPFCNIWEPNALLRLEDSGEESEISSLATSLPTTGVSEVVEEVRDQITAVAIQFRGHYQAIGNEVGVVSVIDSSDGNKPPTRLWNSPVSLPIGHLDWSGDGQYLASTEMSGKVVVRRIQPGNSSNWIVTACFSTKLEITFEGIQQILLNNDGTALLVKNGPLVDIWPLDQSSASSDSKMSITAPDTIWSRHPTDPALLVAFSTFFIKIYRWDDLSEIIGFDVKTPKSLSARLSIKAVKINKVLTDSSGSIILIDTVQTTKESTAHLGTFLDFPINSLASPVASSSTLTSSAVPTEIQDQVEVHLGIISRQRLVFLDKEHWMCSWRFGASSETAKVERHYFLPKDWLNVECLSLCAILADGTFLIPNNGELAVIRCLGLSSHG